MATILNEQQAAIMGWWHEAKGSDLSDLVAKVWNEAQSAQSRDVEKARKWDELDDEIAKFYPEDDENAPGDLSDIGEAAARAFGYL